MESGWKSGPDSNENDDESNGTTNSELVDVRRTTIPSNDSNLNQVVVVDTTLPFLLKELLKL